MKININDLLGVNEAFEIPDKLMQILLNEEKRISIVEKLKQEGFNEEEDFFKDYFQEQQAQRKELKQDYTPDSICKLIKEIAPKANNILDMCAGVGSLTTFLMQDANYQLEELSKNSLAILLFNLSIRGKRALVLRKNVLTREILEAYKVQEDGSVCEIEEIEEITPELIISNPPYSLNWEPMFDERFWGYDLPPKSKADYAFILDAVYRTSKHEIIILPHGVLFRGQNEGNNRERLIQNNLIDAIIGLPGNMFANTSIPTLLLVINKEKADKKVLFIDASKKGTKKAKYNVLEDDVILQIKKAYDERIEIHKFSRVVDIEEIRKNDYNLNIPRYIDTSDEREDIDLEKVLDEITALDEEIRKKETELSDMLKQLNGDEIYDEQAHRMVHMFEKGK